VFYGCSAYHRKGRSICHQDWSAPVDSTNAAVLDVVRRIVSNPAVIDAAIANVTADVLQDGQSGEAGVVEAELQKIETEVANLVGAIAAGGEMSSLVSALQHAEERKGTLARKVREASRPESSHDPIEVRETISGLVTQALAFLGDSSGGAQRVLREMVRERLSATAREEDGKLFIRIEGVCSIAPLLAGNLPQNLASPTGFEPVFWP
jgi:hypothetical protein